MTEKKHFRVLTIAGSDSGGGAGIQADLKTISALGCYGMSAITALTAQNTVSVSGIFPVTPEFIKQQIDAVIEDIGVDAVKIGMLSSSQIIAAVADRLKAHNVSNIVLDPVMVAKSGDKLLEDEAIETLKEKLIPLSTVITPNIPEATVLSHQEIKSLLDMEKAGEKLLKLGCKSVIVKGGHSSSNESTDFVIIKQQHSVDVRHWLHGYRIKTANTHGTGCTLSSAIASFLARGYDIFSAVQAAKTYINNAIQSGSHYKVGHGHGPVQHFYEFW